MFSKPFFRLPSRRRLIISAALLLLLLLSYCLWSPGTTLTDGRHDLGHNAIWISHGYLGDDAWFAQNKKSELQLTLRDPVHLRQTADLFRQHHITDLFPHLCPADPKGSLPPLDHPQAERLLNTFASPEFRVLPWVGGVSAATAQIENPAWRSNFARSCRNLLEQHPRFAGIHLNIEPCPSGNPDFLTLLETLRQALPPWQSAVSRGLSAPNGPAPLPRNPLGRGIL